MTVPLIRRRRVMLATSLAASIAVLLVGALVTSIHLEIDGAIVAWCRSHPPSTIDTVMSWLSASGRSIVLVPLAASIAVLLVIRRHIRLALFAATCVALAPLVSLQVKALFQRERPDVLSLDPQSTFAYPSGHATACATVALVALIICDRLGASRRAPAAIAMWAVGVSISRVWLGAHFPSDILGGWLLAIAITCTCAAIVLHQDRSA